MTSATGEGRLRGFTLFELLIVLAIIALFAGFFVVRFDDGATEEAINGAVSDLKGAALKAKKRAYAFRRDQYIVFSRNGFLLTERPPVPEGAFPSAPENVGGGRSFTESYPLTQGLTMELLPPGEKKWKSDPGYFWTFRSSGLSDPLAVRFSMGRSYSRLSFNVLTGLADEETFIE